MSIWSRDDNLTSLTLANQTQLTLDVTSQLTGEKFRVSQQASLIALSAIQKSREVIAHAGQLATNGWTV